MAGALLGWRAASVRLATPVQAEDQPAASAERDRTVRQVFVLANQHGRWELNDPAGRLGGFKQIIGPVGPVGDHVTLADKLETDVQRTNYFPETA